MSVVKNYIHAAILSDSGEVVADYQTPATTDSYRDCLLAISNSVTELEKRTTAPRITGTALTGVILDDFIQNTPVGWLYGEPINQGLQASLGREIVVSVYSNSSSLFKALYGAGRDGETVFDINIDATCTGGFVAIRRTLTSANGMAGNWRICRFSPRSPMNWTVMIAAAGGPVVRRHLFRLRMSNRITSKSLKVVALPLPVLQPTVISSP